MRRAVKMWDTAKYWTDRADAAVRHAKYKERPDVRARRIKTLEADKRRQERRIAESQKFLKMWQREGLTRALALSSTAPGTSRKSAAISRPGRRCRRLLRASTPTLAADRESDRPANRLSVPALRSLN
jgi:hypothetical protein